MKNTVVQLFKRKGTASISQWNEKKKSNWVYLFFALNNFSRLHSISISPVRLACLPLTCITILSSLLFKSKKKVYERIEN